MWIRQGGCGILVYGEAEGFALGDSIEVGGCLRITNGSYFFPSTGLATLGDLAIENMGATLLGRSEVPGPAAVSAAAFSAAPQTYGGNLVRLSRLWVTSSVEDENGNAFVETLCGNDHILIYIDADTRVSAKMSCRNCYEVTGIAVRMMTPALVCPSPAWCVAPRHGDDIVRVDCSSATVAATWGAVKSRVPAELPRTPLP